MIIAAVFAVQISSADPDYIDPINGRLGPSLDHLMGTDQLGRDMLSRVLSGGKQSIYIGVLASFLANLIGTVLGATAGYLGGKIDAVVMRVSELVMTFPQLILVLIFVSLLGQGINNVIIVFALTGWMTTFRFEENFSRLGKKLSLKPIAHSVSQNLELSLDISCQTQ